MVRFLARMAGKLAVILPVAILGAWGVTYVIACLMVLTAAGVPIEYVYESPGGSITMRAESYSFDPVANLLKLNEVSVVDPSGDQLASARALLVRDVIPGRRPIHAQIDTAFLRLVRLPSGRFQIEDYLPERTEEVDSKQPYAVDVSRLSILYVDRTAQPNGRRWVTSRSLRLDGVGPIWRAVAAIQVDRVGSLTLAARGNASQIFTKFSGSNLFIHDLIAPFARSLEGRSIAELAQIRFASLLVAAQGWVKIPFDRPATWSVQTSGTWRDGRFDGSKAATGSFEGAIGTDGFAGRVVANGNTLGATFDGQWLWSNGQHIAGAFEANIGGFANLPSQFARQVPKEASFSKGRAKGFLVYSDRDGLWASGSASADRATWEQVSLRKIQSTFTVDRDRVSLADASGSYEGSTFKGALDYSFNGGALAGFATATSVDLREALRRSGLVAFEGRASVQAVVFGSMRSPEVSFRASGNGSSREPGYEMRLGAFEVGGRYAKDVVDVYRFSLVGPAGSTTASGSWNVVQDRLHANVLSTSVPLQAFFHELEGSVAFAGEVAGTSKKVVAKGQLEVFNGKAAGQTIPYARGDIRVDGATMQASNVLAFKHGAQASGFGSIDLKSRALDGEFDVEGIDLSRYPPEAMSGIASIAGAKLSGTLDAPILDANLVAENVVYRDWALDTLSARSTLRGGVLHISEALGRVGNGSVAGSGTFKVENGAGSFDLKVSKLPLSSLLAKVAPELSIDGLVSGSLAGTFDGTQISAASASLDVTGLGVNDAILGNGDVRVQSSNGLDWIGSAFLGDLNSYIQLPDLTYNSNAKTINGSVVADNVKAALLYDAAKRYLVGSDGSPLLPQDLEGKIDSATGEIDLDARLSGNISDLDFELTALMLSRLSIAGQSAGEIVAKGTRISRVWNVEQLEWKGGPGTLKVRKGRVDERGDADVDGEVRDFRWSWLAAFNPDLAKVAGRSDVSFLVSGPAKSPEITASASYEEGLPGMTVTPWPGVSVALKSPSAPSRRIDLETVKIREGSIDAAGVFNIDGFTGDIEGKIPFAFPFSIPEGEPLLLSAQIPERPVNSLNSMFGWLDPKTTVGTFKAGVALKGTRADPKLTGLFELKGEKIGLKGTTSGLRDVDLTAKFAESRVDVEARGSSLHGGSFTTEGFGFTLRDLDDLFSGGENALLNNQMFGVLRLNGLGFAYVDPQSGPMSGAISGAIGVAGSFKNPEVSGALFVDSASLAIPSLDVKETEPKNYPINPKFDVSVVASNKLLLRAGTGRFELNGAGRLSGSLTAPILTTNLEVAKGNVRLPNARIAIEPGGSVLVTYRSGASGTSVSRVEVDLIGRTQVTAQSFSGIVERYDVTLTIRGDLLTENGLQLTAQSDPNDLSSDRILAILGQRDILAGSPGDTFRADRQLQSALLGLAIPYFAGSLTEQLASKLGLDYLNVEYNTFDQFSVTAAVTLSRDFVLSGRRQLLTPLPGEPLRYDLRLSYRPPFKSRALRRFTFSVGTDQDRPWKVTVEYGIRF